MSTADTKEILNIYAKIARQLTDEDGVTIGAHGKMGFGSTALRVNGKIFAMVTSGEQFVVKLPRYRVESLESEGIGQKFDPGHGRLMKEWLSLRPGSEHSWLALSKEALDFVSG